MGSRYVVRSGHDPVATAHVLSDDGRRAVVRIERSGEEPVDVVLDLDPAGGGGRYLTSVPDAQALGHSLVDIIPGGRGEWHLLRGQDAFDFTVISERDTWLAGSQDEGGAGRVTVAMPGKVVVIDAILGSPVVKGQRLLVIEAMKMENDVKSPRDGIVKGVFCKVGDAVEGGATLIEIE